jgi:hypothetical protein
LKSAVKPSPVCFPLELPLRYKAKSPDRAVFGTGCTKWIGSREIAFAAAKGIQKHMKAEIAIAWPLRLEGRVRLQLSVTAILTHVAEGVAVARIVQYDFRTRGEKEPVGEKEPAQTLMALPAGSLSGAMVGRQAHGAGAQAHV